MHKYQIVSKRCQSGMEFSLFTLSSSLFQAFVFSSLCCSGLSQWLHWDNKSCFQSHVKPSVLAEPSALTANPAERLGGKSLDWDVTIPVGIRRLWFPFFLLRAQQMSACWHLEGMSSFSVSLLGSVLLSKRIKMIHLKQQLCLVHDLLECSFNSSDALCPGWSLPALCIRVTEARLGQEWAVARSFVELQFCIVIGP